jgi:chemotaxis protein MotC
MPPLPPPPPPSVIETMVRHLQDLQERVSAGDGVAFAEMPKHLRALGRTIFDAPAEAWEKKENTHALIIYLLSGGNPNAGRKALASPKFNAGDAPIAKASVAYLENVEGADRDFMLSLNPFTLDPTLGGAIAFVQSILLTPQDREAAVDKLDLARLLSPGGLVEEAALRREIGLLAEANKYERFAALARRYWARYRASPYAENFLRQFMLGVARVSLSIKLAEWEQLDDFIESLTPDTKRNLYLTVAQNASVVGNVALAAMAAQRARDLSAENSQERQRAIVYGAAASVGTAGASQSVHLLDGVDRAQLPAGDQPIYDAVAFVTGRIFHAPAKGFKEPPPKDPIAAGANPADADMARAEKLLQQGDAVIASVRKTMERTNP